VAGRPVVGVSTRGADVVRSTVLSGAALASRSRVGIWFVVPPIVLAVFRSTIDTRTKQNKKTLLFWYTITSHTRSKLTRYPGHVLQTGRCFFLVSYRQTEKHSLLYFVIVRHYKQSKKLKSIWDLDFFKE
jgi:hypothetical protein